MPRPTSRNVPGSISVVRIDRPRPRELGGSRLRRLAPDRVAEAARQAGCELRDTRHARDERRVPRVVAQRARSRRRGACPRARAPARPGAGASAAAARARRRAARGLRPSGRRRSRRARRRASRATAAALSPRSTVVRLLGKWMPRVLRVPDERRRSPAAARGDEVPVLPRDETALRDRGRGRRDERSNREADGGGDHDARHVATRQAGEDREARRAG